ncbi:MAG: hypothetical protein K8T25_19720, partial [Planctomycetia bacterium]|nr:hypothetical protein [Planctomycetia bacterium]
MPRSSGSRRTPASDNLERLHSDDAGPLVYRQRPLAHDPAAPIGAVYLKTATRSPVIYRKRIDRIDSARPGDLVAVYGPGDELLGYGLFNPRSEIAVRVVRAGSSLPDDPFWQ